MSQLPKNIRDIIDAAAVAYGTDAGVLRQMAFLESGGRNVVNNWDSNAKAGTPSAGILQFIQPTFDGYSRNAKKANPGAWRGVPMDWRNPQAQALAASWAVKNGHGKAWATYDRALGSKGTVTPVSSVMPRQQRQTRGGVDSSARKAALLAFIFQGSPLAGMDFSQFGAGDPAPIASVQRVGKPAQAQGVAAFGGKQVAAWIRPILAYARQHGWSGGVTSGLRSLADQQRIWNSGVRPAARPGTSNHEMTAFPGGAIDVSNAQQLSDILKGSPYAGQLVWAGSKDPVHFSHPHNGAY